MLVALEDQMLILEPDGRLVHHPLPRRSLWKAFKHIWLAGSGDSNPRAIKAVQGWMLKSCNVRFFAMYDTTEY